jgi:hypothetical protein
MLLTKDSPSSLMCNGLINQNYMKDKPNFQSNAKHDLPGDSSHL